MSSFTNILSGRQKVPLSGFLEFTPLTYDQRNHLCRVYMFLASSILFTAFGVSVSYVFMPPLLLCILAHFFFLYYIISTSYMYMHGSYNLKNSQDVKRLGAFGGAAFSAGLMISPYLKYANYINPTIVPTAFYSTLAIFVCFSVSALMSIDRRYLYLGGILASSIFYISMLVLFNMFFRSVIAHKIILYGGLIVYMGYVLYDTQLILYDISHRGIKDPLLHAMAFYGDIIGIFVKILQILAEKQEKKEE